MLASSVLKWITGGLEAFLGIPLIGGTFILAFEWLPLFAMFILHLATLIVSVIDKKKFHGSILGITASVLGWIPFLGMTLHILAAIFLLTDAYKSQKTERVSQAG